MKNTQRTFEVEVPGSPDSRVARIDSLLDIYSYAYRFTF